jgi:hypothetical protein
MREDFAPHHAAVLQDSSLAHTGLLGIDAQFGIRRGRHGSEKTDCIMILSKFPLEVFDRISGIMTDAYLFEEKLMIARRTRARVALIEDLLHGRQARRHRGAGTVRAVWIKLGLTQRGGDRTSQRQAHCAASRPAYQHRQFPAQPDSRADRYRPTQLFWPVAAADDGADAHCQRQINRGTLDHDSATVRQSWWHRTILFASTAASASTAAAHRPGRQARPRHASPSAGHRACRGPARPCRPFPTR